MVVNPENLVQKIEHHEAQRIAAVEAYIDKTLETAFDGTKAIVPGDHGFRGMRDFVLKGLLDRYRAAGWNIKYQSDQREGSWYEFTPIRRGSRNISMDLDPRDGYCTANDWMNR